jgi:hypothetical protein
MNPALPVPRSPQKPARYKALFAFIDDSHSTRSLGFMCLAGIVVRDERCNPLAHDWLTLLNRHGLDHLHCSDFLSNQGKPLDADEYARRAHIVGEFARLIRTHADATVLVGLESKDLYGFPSKDRKGIGPIEFCLYRVMRACLDFKSPGETFQFVFDDSPKDAPKMYSAWGLIKTRQLIPRQYMGSISFADDQLTPQLQAADLVACGVVRHFPKNRDGWPQDAAFGPLYADDGSPIQMRISGQYWDKEAFDRLGLFRPGASDPLGASEEQPS